MAELCQSGLAIFFLSIQPQLNLFTPLDLTPVSLPKEIVTIVDKLGLRISPLFPTRHVMHYPLSFPHSMLLEYPFFPFLHQKIFFFPITLKKFSLSDTYACSTPPLVVLKFPPPSFFLMPQQISLAPPPLLAYHSCPQIPP